MSIKDSTIQRKKLKIKKTDENKNIYIRLIDPNTFEYGVGADENDVKVCEKVEI
jgi:hypothetical protein